MIDQLAALIRRAPLTAREIAERLGVSKPTAYKLIRSLIERGDRVFTERRNSGRPGPAAVAYGVRHRR